MKKTLLVGLCLTVLSISKAQYTISPSETSEYCPGVEYTFNVTTSKNYASMIGIGGCSVTQPPSGSPGTTFTFKGKFADANIKQTFRIDHPDNTSTFIEFKKIKSLFFSTGCSMVGNQAPVTVPRCQVVNIPITVANVQWETKNESPAFCFGSISDFEYQIPNGWSIGAQSSNGSNWIPGGNSVTVTSDLANGVGGVILVRPRNTCGTGLLNGVSPGQIPVSRPAPNLQLTSSDGRFYVCSGTRSFTLSNVPSGASILWELLSTTNATISGANNLQTVTVQRNTTTNTTVDLKATVTHCSFSYVVNQSVVLGTGVSDFTFTSLYNTVSTINGYPEAFVWATVTEVPQVLNYNWYYKKHTGIGPGGGTGGSFTWVGTTGGNHNEFTLPECDKNYTIKVEAGAPCATLVTPAPEGLLYADCSGSFRMSVSPNPTAEMLNVSIDTDDKKGKIEQFEIIDQRGIVVQKGTGNKSRQFQINIRRLRQGQHVLRIFNGKIWASKIFIKQ